MIKDFISLIEIWLLKYEFISLKLYIASSMIEFKNSCILLKITSKLT